MLRFLYREIDVLVCTTIIESGLDIPSANTIIVNRVDRFGPRPDLSAAGARRPGGRTGLCLSLHSRGKRPRQGRPETPEGADGAQRPGIGVSDRHERPQAPGGGTILGASQSGHIAAVGYDMFLKLMEDAVSELKGEPIKIPLEPEINVPMSFFIPESYIPDIDQRLSAYRRMSKMTSVREISEFRSELIDRFGPLPDETGNLFLKIMLKILAENAGVKRLDLSDTLLSLHFSEEHQKNPFGIVDLITERPDQFTFTPDHVLKVKLTGSAIGGRLTQTKNILKEISPAC